VQEKDLFKTKLGSETEAKNLKDFKVKQLENKVLQLEKQIISDKELKEILSKAQSSTVGKPSATTVPVEEEIVKRLEKKVKKLEREKFEHDMQLTEQEAKHNEALRKLAVKLKVLESGALNQALKVGDSFLFSFIFIFIFLCLLVPTPDTRTLFISALTMTLKRETLSLRPSGDGWGISKSTRPGRIWK